MLMDSATSPSAPRRMTGQKHTAKGESFQTRETDQKKICCYEHWYWVDAVCTGYGLKLGKLIFKRFVSLRKNKGSSLCTVCSCTF